jgi:hypothetical protein
LDLYYYSLLSNNRGGWNKREGRAKVAKSINVEVGINVEGGIFWKKLVHKCNRRGGWKKSKKSINVEGGNVRGGWIFFSNQ